MKRPLIGLGLSAVLFLLSIGLCGADGNLNAHGALVSAGLAALVLSLLGGAGSFIWLLVVLLRGR